MGHRILPSATFLVGWSLACWSLPFAPASAQSGNPSRTSSPQVAPRSTPPRTAQTQFSSPQSGPGQRGPAPRGPAQPRLNPPPANGRAPVPDVSRTPPPTLGPKTPPGFPLSPEKQARVDQILKYWEHHTERIKTHECEFVRENFDFVFGSKDTPATVDVGIVRYKAPDKGLMRVEQVYKVNAEATDEKDRYEQQDVQFGEYWVCDGSSIFQFDSRTKVLTETKLPPEMRGQSIGDGPLPFLFGAKAEKMKQRYWIREVTPEQNPDGEYFLEATPRRQEDAANFDKILVQLSREGDYLFPKAMRLYNKQGYTQYRMRKHTPNDPRHRIAAFLKYFVSPSTPQGWTKVVEDWSAEPSDPRQAATPPRGQGVPPKKR